jgi:hypothetical protein
MAKDFNKAAIITSKDGLGLLYTLPVGTTSSPEPTVALPAGSGSVGTISDGGTTVSESADGGTTITDSDGDAVRVTAGSVTRSINFTIWELDNPVALGLIFHPDDIEVDEDGTITGYNDSGRTPPARKLIMEFQTDTDRIGRRTFHNVTFQSRGDEVINSQGIAGREVTYTINRDTETGTYSQTRLADRA